MIRSSEKAGIVFDVDGTFYVSPEFLRSHLKDNCWLELTFKICLQKGNLSIQEALNCVKQHEGIYQDFIEKRISHDEMVFKLFEIWNKWGSVTRKEIEDIVKGFTLRPHTLDVVRDLKEIATISINTGAFDLTALTMAKLLGIDPQFAFANTELIFNPDGIWVGFKHKGRIQEVKVENGRSFVTMGNFDKVVSIGDGESDVKLFSTNPRDLGPTVREHLRIQIGSNPILKDISDYQLNETDWNRLPELIRNPQAFVRKTRLAV